MQAHAQDYLAYAYLQTGQDALAKKVRDEVSGYRDRFGESPRAAYSALLGIPARYALERHQWSEQRLSPFEKFPCPCMKPKPISRGRSAARAQAISPVRGPMLTSSRSFVIDCRKEIKVGRATPTWWKYNIYRLRHGWPMRKSARQTPLS